MISEKIIGLMPGERFMARVHIEDHGCWEWMGNHHTHGHPYGLFKLDGRSVLTHRYSWSLFRGEIPHGLCVCHRCDNPKCVNPEHLFLGTHLENMRDCQKKGRKSIKKGEDHPYRKLDSNQVNSIRRLAFVGFFSQRELSEMFGVTKEHIRNVVFKKSWTTSTN